MKKAIPVPEDVRKRMSELGQRSWLVRVGLIPPREKKPRLTKLNPKLLK